MPPDPAGDPRATTIEQLEHLGLSAYAARTFVALASLGTGTAREVSQVSAVPRTRVSDAADELKERGLVAVQHASPRQFWAVSSETASRTFEREQSHRTDRLRTVLGELEPIERRPEQRGVWTVEGQRAVSERVLDFFASAEEELVYMTVEDLLSEELIEGLAAADARGVTIELAGVSADVQRRLQGAIPNAERFESLWAWSDTPAGRLMMVDGKKTLVSALVDGETADPSDPRRETAIWGEGVTNSLVVVLNAIFTWRLGSGEPE